MGFTKGLDVSVVQGRVDWPAAYELGCRFAFIKCTEGNRGYDPVLALPENYVDHRRAAGIVGIDPLFDVHTGSALRAGMRVAPYHFCYPLPHQDGNPVRDPEAQAKFFWDGAAGLGASQGDLPPMVDLEWPPPEGWGKWGCTKPQLIHWGLSFLACCEQLWRRPPVLYTYPDFWSHLGGAAEPAFARYPLCMASYPHPARWPLEAEPAPHVGPWERATFWQFTGGGMRLPGGAPVDYEVFCGDEQALAKFCEG